MKILPPALAYRPAKPKDFQGFWKATLQEAQATPTKAALRRKPHPLSQLEVHEVRFRGFEGAELAAWYLLPKKRSGRIPAALYFHGYSWCKGEPENYLHWIMLGMAVLAVDVRGQLGDSGAGAGAPGGHAAGWMTQGILDPERYYYRGAYADTRRAMDFLRSRPEVDAKRIVATGESQGGGLALAAACLDPGVALCTADNPSLMGMPARLRLGSVGSIEELRAYLRAYPERTEAALRTLSYFDLLNHLPALRCPSLWSASLNDPICPAETVEAGFDVVKSKDKKIYFHRDMGHDVHASQMARKLAFVAERFGL